MISLLLTPAQGETNDEKMFASLWDSAIQRTLCEWLWTSPGSHKRVQKSGVTNYGLRRAIRSVTIVRTDTTLDLSQKAEKKRLVFDCKRLWEEVDVPKRAGKKKKKRKVGEGRGSFIACWAGLCFPETSRPGLARIRRHRRRGYTKAWELA